LSSKKSDIKIESGTIGTAIDLGIKDVFNMGAVMAPAAADGGTGKIAAPMPGKVIAVLVQVGDRVEHGQPVVVVEAMKMETTLTADVDGEVARIGTAVGEKIDAGALLVEITPAASSA
jgi:biotin carboxyl carrier protein